MPNAQQLIDQASIPTRCVRRLMAKRPRERRGIVLIFVVVLLMLLAIMGTAYLAASRADRQPITARGSLPDTIVPRVYDRTRLDTIFDASASRIKLEMIQSLFNLEPNSMSALALKVSQAPVGVPPPEALALFATFRQQGINSPTLAHPIYQNYDAPGRADRWLSTLMPEQPSRATPVYEWPVISAPIGGELLPGLRLEPFFSDPRFLTRKTPIPARGVAGLKEVWAAQDDRYADGDVKYSTEVHRTDGSDVSERIHVRMSAMPMQREDSHTEQSHNTRLYPALSPMLLPNKTYIAGDADGDGIPDSGLMPVILNTDATGIERYLDATNGVVYFVGYRIVDNSAQINVNTALTAKGDFSTMAVNLGTSEKLVTGSATDELRNRIAYLTPDSSNLGFFRTNVGLGELIKNSLEVYGKAENTTNNMPYFREMFRLADARFPVLNRVPPSNIEGANIKLLALTDDPAKLGTVGQVTATYGTGQRTTYTSTATTDEHNFEFRSLGDMAEQLIARRPETTGGVRWLSSATGSTPQVDTTGVISLPAADAANWAIKSGSLINELTTPADGENALAMTTHYAAPNFSASGQPLWKWFPLSLDGTDNGVPTAIKLWFDWTHDFQMNMIGDISPTAAFDPTKDFRVALLDSPSTSAGYLERGFQFSAPSGTNLADVVLPRSLRPLLTTISGITNAVPMRKDTNAIRALNGLPKGMPAYGNDRTKGEYPAIKVAAATATKEQLWRGYWSAMTQNQNQVGQEWIVDSAGAPGSIFEAFQAPDRHPSKTTTGTLPAPINRLDDRSMALVRSAVAACNTVDLRDADNDITAMTVDLGSTVTDGSGERLFARVYGTEKQLVISAVVIDKPAESEKNGSSQPFVAVEIYNPSDEELDLSGYYLAVVDRPTTVDSVDLTNGKIDVHNPSANPMTSGSLKPLTGSTKLKPGGLLIVGSEPLVTEPRPGITIEAEVVPAPTPPVGGPWQVTWLPTNVELLNLLSQKSELMLVRTRRADGNAYVDPATVVSNAYSRPKFDEGTGGTITKLSDLASLVPMDAVDCRALTYTEDNDTGNRYWYLRNTNSVTDNETTPNALAWKCFYAGKFYELRPGGTGPGGSPNPSIPPAIGTWAWRGAGGGLNDRTSAASLGRYRLTPQAGGSAISGTGTPLPPSPYYTPTIPIQNFTPTTIIKGPAFNQTIPTSPTFYVDHPPYRFPYGSPFARNGDLLTVPFIGSYKIYALPSGFTAATPAAQYRLYEYVPITMDAVNVAPTADATILDNPSIGRFDPSGGVILPATVPPAPPATAGSQSNSWASDLFDFVVARQSSADQMYFPDVPASEAITTSGSGTTIKKNDPTDPLTDQDGTIQGAETAVNAATGVTWVKWSEDPSGAVAGSPARQGGTVVVAGGSQLIEGIININTAPAVVLRMLPWAVSFDQGMVDLTQGTDANTLQRRRVGVVEKELYDQASGRIFRPAGTTPWGIPSLMDLMSLTAFRTLQTDEMTRFQTTLGTQPALTQQQDLMHLGVLNAQHRAQKAPGGDPFVNDVVIENAALTRISNLASTRSDAFTVYITVQAWTWVGDRPNADQTQDTRLVGERRMSFIVDRSRISQTNYSTADLLVYPGDQD